MKIFIWLGVVLGLAAVEGVRAAEGWSQWRGANRDGTVAEAGSWPASLGEGTLQKVWEVELAEGYSSPVVGGGKVFSVETRDKKAEIARAFDLGSGAPVWELDWEGAMKVPFFAAKNGSWVRATPAAKGGSLYVAGMRDVLVSIDAETGEEEWRVDFVEREGTQLPSFGYVSSPLVDGNDVYVQAGMAVAKLDRRTGETKWRALEDRRAMFGSAFSSPVIATIGGKRQLVVQARMELSGLDLETGKVLWSTEVKAFRGMNILTPMVIGDEIFTATYGGGSFLFRVSREGDAWSVAPVWNDEKIEGYMSSPLAIGEHIYLLGRDERLYCLERATGAVAWKTKEKFGKYLSMVANGTRVLALDDEGEMLLFEASPAGFEVLDRRRVTKEDTWAHVGVEGDLVLVRGLRSLAAYRWRG
ncbi:MAG: PQQ-binding-like beta-propeller repeat protein [Verrucomicrobiota bacterium]